MCGISGILKFNSGEKVDRRSLQRMADSIIHRGPDGEGFFLKGPIGLAHRRLAIIDLETGNQPMLSDDGKLALVLNGEIYNYIELREELKSLGHFFNTSSDTEVVLRAYEQWGLDFHARLNGMWALALWDEHKQQLLLSRDRIGEKPLHYAEWNGSLLFGSEIKCLLTAGMPSEINLEVLELYLTFGYVHAPHSFYKNVKKIRPGHFLLVHGNNIADKCYWEIPSCDERTMRGDREQIEEEFESLLKDSVRLRMRSDVAFGAFLSGGLDSSSIVALMSEVSKRQVETFTIGFDEKNYDERPLARLVSKRFGTDHHESSVTAASFEFSLNHILHHFDEPFGDSSAIPTGRVSDYAHRYVKMALSGDGGDEVLSGYNAYQSEKLAAIFQKISNPFRPLIQFPFLQVAQVVRGNMRIKLNQISRILATSFLDFEDRLLKKASWFDREKLKLALAYVHNPMIDAREFLGDFMKNCPFNDGFYRMMWFNLKFSLPDDMLVKVDRMSMAHSLEVRVPFLEIGRASCRERV